MNVVGKSMCLAAIGLLYCVSLDNAVAWQTATRERPAVIAIDINLERLEGSGLDEVLKAVQASLAQNDAQGVILSAQRLTASISAPESVEAVTAFGPGQPIPLDFYLRLQFADGELKAYAFEIMKNGFEPVTENGVSRFKPPTDGPANIRLVDVDATTVELGTLNYLNRADRRMHSVGLNDLWNSMPEQAIRLAIDMDGARTVVDDLAKMLSQSGLPSAKPFIDMLTQMSSLKLSVDVKDKNLLSLAITGRDATATDELHVNLDGFLNMAKFMLGTQVAELKKDSPQVGEVMGKILSSLRAVKSENLVTVDIPRPEGLEVAVTQAIERARQAAGEVQSMNRFRYAALAVHNYYSAYNRLPFSVVPDRFDSGNLSWRVRVLPYVEEMALFEGIDKKSAWDNSSNAPFYEQMPELFGNNSNSKSDICWVKPSKPFSTFPEILDGMSNTIMLVQNPAGVPWMRTNDMTVDEVLEMFKKLPEGQFLLVAMFDGSVHKMGAGIDQEELRSLLEPADGK